jgi:xyloglucan-specific endo-beta-1,4-glucanase
MIVQASAYGQCGGQGWSGATTCVSGYTCVYSNDYYSQCQPGSGSPGTTTKSTSTVSTTKTTTSTSTAPSSTSGVDTTQHCEQYGTIKAGSNYVVYTDLWGQSGATSGQQCVHLTSVSGNTVGFSTTFTWNGGNGVKSFTNVNLNTGINKVLSQISTIPVCCILHLVISLSLNQNFQSTASWTYTYSGSIVSDVAYDLFTSTSAGGSNAYEIMIWLANLNAGPISYNYGSDGKPVAIASNLSIAGHTWNLYYGTNGANYVYSFLPTSGTIPSFSGDINLFLKVRFFFLFLLLP